MKIYYQGADISNIVSPIKCIIRDTCGGSCDSLDIEFRNAAGWYSWNPQEDDQIIVEHNGYDSGIMYVSAVIPENNRYRIFATSLPCKARTKANKSFSGKTVREIIELCAMASGMQYQVFGGIGDVYVPFIIREDESCAAFLHRLLTLEGAALKCVNGKYTAIGIEYAQNRIARQGLSVFAKRQREAEYHRDGMTLKGLTVTSPYASATAEDRIVPDNHRRETINGLPAMDKAQAGRWARGKLLDYNRRCESVRIPMEFNPQLTALERIDITGDTDATGSWLVDTVEHDLINLTSTASMFRCVRTIH